MTTMQVAFVKAKTDLSFRVRKPKSQKIRKTVHKGRIVGYAIDVTTGLKTAIVERRASSPVQL